MSYTSGARTYTHTNTQHPRGLRHTHMRAKEKVPEPTYHLVYRDTENLKKGEYTWYEARYFPIGDVDNPKLNTWTTPGAGSSEFRDCFGALEFLKKKVESTRRAPRGELRAGKYNVVGFVDAEWSEDKSTIIINTNQGAVEITVGKPGRRKF